MLNIIQVNAYVVGKYYTVVEENEYQNIGAVGLCVNTSAGVTLLFQQRNHRTASAWPDIHHMYSGDNTVTEMDYVGPNTLGNFPKREGV